MSQRRPRYNAAAKKCQMLDKDLDIPVSAELEMWPVGSLLLLAKGANICTVAVVMKYITLGDVQIHRLTRYNLMSSNFLQSIFTRSKQKMRYLIPLFTILHSPSSSAWSEVRKTRTLITLWMWCLCVCVCVCVFVGNLMHFHIFSVQYFSQQQQLESLVFTLTK